MEYDVVIVGAGPAGLSAAIRLRQINPEISVCVVEKGSEVGAHILSGAVFEPTALNELLPEWKSQGAPLNTEVAEDHIYLLKNGEKGSRIPNFLAPKTMHNHGNYIISLGNLCRWLAEQAEGLGVEIFPGFAAAEVLYHDDGSVKGIATGDMGISREGEQKDSYMPGMELHAKYTLFCEGCRGHLGKELIAKYSLDEGKDPQHYGIGIKEIWKVSDEQHQQGLVVHSAGWPLSESSSTGGGFLYHIEDNQVVVGLITDLSYTNPHVSPFDEFQRYKHHPVIKQYLEGGERIAYGARAIAKGGLQSQPKMSFPGGLLLGCDAGTLNFAKIKGSHTAMKSGMIGAEVVAEALKAERQSDDLVEYAQAYQDSWAYKELHQQRNFGPAQHRWGNLIGSAYSFIDLNLFNGALPWTLSDPIADHDCLKTADRCQPITYPKPDNKLSFDKLSSVFLSNTNHEEDQPIHLQLKDPSVPLAINLPKYNEPAQRYCPAGVYEVVTNESGEKAFQINAQNCVHCKTCDIKDPTQNIRWVAPEGTGGPNYPNM
ncbi:electron transfer flavoprotein-ubiquinone oxidoreductase [Marinibactrum halimedae]|uniref:Electron transfer flavoprotein-ubiquinone oxidoreductase n=1 Tax=Marinibactrum halimedae TaxID=1444977 RepID=A0AA37TFF7_9GAMM|nr:electron transfer flavoprotein-ubiquinone oxidoreductase [Marinibactrum halimedae]GLS28122.1 electron transfer flavoprotein-ubiquinone oxidoreductase [Marinibactrum halimedae]